MGLMTNFTRLMRPRSPMAYNWLQHCLLYRNFYESDKTTILLSLAETYLVYILMNQEL